MEQRCVVVLQGIKDYEGGENCEATGYGDDSLSSQDICIMHSSQVPGEVSQKKVILYVRQLYNSVSSKTVFNRQLWGTKKMFTSVKVLCGWC